MTHPGDTQQAATQDSTALYNRTQSFGTQAFNSTIIIMHNALSSCKITSLPPLSHWSVHRMQLLQSLDAERRWPPLDTTQSMVDTSYVHVDLMIALWCLHSGMPPPHASHSLSVLPWMFKHGGSRCGSWNQKANGPLAKRLSTLIRLGYTWLRRVSSQLPASHLTTSADRHCCRFLQQFHRR